ncbi:MULTISPECIES: PhzF family phenazine biosynthesis protein [Paeniglutamicibacter]|uniref:PhzF family phenazine biosynthesis protein n=1 Tax=Paeniglutamicibacter terrestris TaxID=2723403 RepID=A0ABX1FZJ5_9MICC|nr:MULTISPECIES: PhzF family phenazine biosynthesis protein [Paeniglutamicibacter]NKG19378.1 PhzF family phenazine biosynthesis protein [Paeniglutamicibacter terrestris]QXQ09607.1 PhzF family phenazine biosynthesis protein [Paeniglutamicibacter sp. Y32M11]
MSIARPYKQVDVFSSSPYTGNGLAVVLDGEDLSDAQLLAFANWTNLAETVFLLPATHPDADYRARIFTTTTELPFAGHPTLGAAHAWLEAGGVPKNPEALIQECGAGLIEIRRVPGEHPQDPESLAFKAPPLMRTGELEEDVLDWALAGLGITRDDVLAHQWLVNGPNWAGLLLRDAELVLSLEPDFVALAGLEIGVIGAHTVGAKQSTSYDPMVHQQRPAGAREELRPVSEADVQRSQRFRNVVTGAPADYEVRAFCPGEGLQEDPATGSLNAGFGAWLTGSGLAPSSYTVRQGTRVGRAAIVQVDSDADGIWIAGHSMTCIDGTVILP